MAHFDTTYPVMFGTEQVAEIEVRISVDPNSFQPIEVQTFALGHRWTKLIATPEPVRTQVIEWAWQTKREHINEAFAEFAHGAMQYSREVARAAQ